MQLGVSSQSDDWFMWFEAWKKKKNFQGQKNISF